LSPVNHIQNFQHAFSEKVKTKQRREIVTLALACNEFDMASKPSMRFKFSTSRIEVVGSRRLGSDQIRLFRPSHRFGKEAGTAPLPGGWLTSYFLTGRTKEAENVYKQALLEASKSNDKLLQSEVASMVHEFPKKK